MVDVTPGSSDGLLIEQRGAVGWITLDRADVRNAITHGQRMQLVATLSDWSADPTVRAVVITGSGGSFCAGADLRSNEGLPDRPDGAPERIGGDLVRRQKRSAQSLIAGILDCEKPVIAALNWGGRRHGSPRGARLRLRRRRPGRPPPGGVRVQGLGARRRRAPISSPGSSACRR